MVGGLKASGVMDLVMLKHVNRERVTAYGRKQPLGIQGREKMKAIWNDTEIANSDDTVVVEGNHYFPLSSVNGDYLRGVILTPFVRGRARRATTILRSEMR